jgi:hypothetical protein
MMESNTPEEYRALVYLHLDLRTCARTCLLLNVYVTMHYNVVYCRLRWAERLQVASFTFIDRSVSFAKTHTIFADSETLEVTCDKGFCLLGLYTVKIYSTIILPVVLYGCETWSLTLGEERRLKVFENSELRIFGPKRDEVTGNGENYIMRSLIFCTLHPVLCGR